MNLAQRAITTDISIRPLRQADLPTVDHIFRLAFGTFLGLPDPLKFHGDGDIIRTRYLADPAATIGAEVDGELAGSNFLSNWGSVGFFGPLSVHPDLWDQGIAKRLLEPTMDLFSSWRTRHAGLFTFAQSPKHVHLYEKFGFWPRFLTMIMTVPVRQTALAVRWSKYSDLPASERGEMLDSCRELTDTIYEGLDVRREIRAVHSQGLGDTVLITANSKLVGLAVCHCGPGTEAGRGMCYVKFGAVRQGPTAGATFDRLLNACEALAAQRGMSRLVCGVNSARHQAYRQMLAYGFRTDFAQGIVMERPNEPGYNREDVYIVDDWR